ncbi:hypothetical protein HYV80_06595 [Candidatus Woesearchaeota archaeon]|nr:hypothetical protein [Candidatus Woesearchaeota archaeon]
MSNKILNGKTAKGLASLVAVVIILSSILATGVYYNNSITSNAVREVSVGSESKNIFVTEVDSIEELNFLNEGWYEIRKGFVFYLDTFNSYVPLYIKVKNFEQQNGLLAVDMGGNIEFGEVAHLLEKEIADEELDGAAEEAPGLEDVSGFAAFDNKDVLMTMEVKVPFGSKYDWWGRNVIFEYAQGQWHVSRTAFGAFREPVGNFDKVLEQINKARQSDQNINEVSTQIAKKGVVDFKAENTQQLEEHLNTEFAELQVTSEFINTVQGIIPQLPPEAEAAAPREAEQQQAAEAPTQAENIEAKLKSTTDTTQIRQGIIEVQKGDGPRSVKLRFDDEAKSWQYQRCDSTCSASSCVCGYWVTVESSFAQNLPGSNLPADDYWRSTVQGIANFAQDKQRGINLLNIKAVNDNQNSYYIPDNMRTSAAAPASAPAAPAPSAPAAPAPTLAPGVTSQQVEAASKNLLDTLGNYKYLSLTINDKPYDVYDIKLDQGKLYLLHTNGRIEIDPPFQTAWIKYLSRQSQDLQSKIRELKVPIPVAAPAPAPSPATPTDPKTDEQKTQDAIKFNRDKANANNNVDDILDYLAGTSEGVTRAEIEKVIGTGQDASSVNKIKLLQTALGTSPDGALGRNTYNALANNLQGIKKDTNGNLIIALTGGQEVRFGISTKGTSPQPAAPPIQVTSDIVKTWKEEADKQHVLIKGALPGYIGTFYVDDDGYVWETTYAEDGFAQIIRKAGSDLKRGHTYVVDKDGKVEEKPPSVSSSQPAPASTAPAAPAPSAPLTPSQYAYGFQAGDVIIGESGWRAEKQSDGKWKVTPKVGAIYRIAEESMIGSLKLENTIIIRNELIDGGALTEPHAPAPAPTPSPPVPIVQHVLIGSSDGTSEDKYYIELESSKAEATKTAEGYYDYKGEDGRDYRYDPSAQPENQFYVKSDQGVYANVNYVPTSSAPGVAPTPAAPSSAPAASAVPPLAPAIPPHPGISAEALAQLKANPVQRPGTPQVPTAPSAGQQKITQGQQPLQRNLVDLGQGQARLVEVYPSQSSEFLFVYPFDISAGQAPKASQPYALHKSQLQGVNFAGWDGNPAAIPLTTPGAVRTNAKCEETASCSFTDTASKEGKVTQKTETSLALGANGKELRTNILGTSYDSTGKAKATETSTDSIAGTRLTISYDGVKSGGKITSVSAEKNGKKTDISPEAYKGILSGTNEKVAAYFFGEAANRGLARIDKVQATKEDPSDPGGSISYVGNLNGIHLLLMGSSRIGVKDGKALVGYIDESRGLSATIEGPAYLSKGQEGYLLSEGATAFVREIASDGTVTSNRVEQQTKDSFVSGEYKDAETKREVKVTVTKKDGTSAESTVNLNTVQEPKSPAYGMHEIKGTGLYINSGETGFGWILGSGGGEIYKIENGKLVRAETAEAIAVKNNINKERENRGMPTFEQVSSQRFFANVERVFTDFQGLGYYATLFFDEDSLLKWRDNVDRMFATAYLGTEYWTSSVCGEYLDGENEGIAWAETPQGLAQVAAHIEATRTEPILTPTGTEYIYKITFNVRNGDYAKDPRAPEVMNINVVLRGERTVTLFRQDQEVKRGSSFGRIGRSAIVQDSPAFYNEICLTFDQTPLRWKTRNGEVCNTIVESSGAPTSVSSSASSSGSGSGAAQGEINDF